MELGCVARLPMSLSPAQRHRQRKKVRICFSGLRSMTTNCDDDEVSCTAVPRPAAVDVSCSAKVLYGLHADECDDEPTEFCLPADAIDCDDESTKLCLPADALTPLGRCACRGCCEPWSPLDDSHPFLNCESTLVASLRVSFPPAFAAPLLRLSPYPPFPPFPLLAAFVVASDLALPKPSCP